VPHDSLTERAAAVIVAVATAPWLAILLAIPAMILWIWQLPPRERVCYQVAAGPSCESRSALTMVSLLTINARGGAADPAALLPTLQSHNVDVLAVQELTLQMVSRLTAAGLATAAIFPSRSTTWLTRGRTVGTLADDSATAGAGSALIRQNVDVRRWATGGDWGLQRQARSPAVPRSPGGRLPGLRRLQREPVVAGIHLADWVHGCARFRVITIIISTNTITCHRSRKYG